MLVPTGSVVTDVPCPVIWPCDIQGYLDAEGAVQVVNYILDDVSAPFSTPSLVLTHVLRRTSRGFWLTHFQLVLGWRYVLIHLASSALTE